MHALILVDLQNDFMPGGALAVRDGDRILPVANALARRFELVLATQDWHPPDHGSFVTQHPGHAVGDVIDLSGLAQVLWPPHCVQGTTGAELHPDLDRSRIGRVFQKGTERHIDSYSGFYDNGHRHSTGLGEYLRERGVDQLFVAGLATDYCVKYTAEDARRLGFRTCLVLDACRGVELAPGDSQRAVDDMRRAGVEVVQSHAVLR
jgi:nicotinamidase/pyrazinamidase